MFLLAACLTSSLSRSVFLPLPSSSSSPASSPPLIQLFTTWLGEGGGGGGSDIDYRSHVVAPPVSTYCCQIRWKCRKLIYSFSAAALRWKQTAPALLLTNPQKELTPKQTLSLNRYLYRFSFEGRGGAGANPRPWPWPIHLIVLKNTYCVDTQTQRNTQLYSRSLDCSSSAFYCLISASPAALLELRTTYDEGQTHWARQLVFPSTICGERWWWRLQLPWSHAASQLHQTRSFALFWFRDPQRPELQIVHLSTPL